MKGPSPPTHLPANISHPEPLSSYPVPQPLSPTLGCLELLSTVTAGGATVLQPQPQTTQQLQSWQDTRTVAQRLRPSYRVGPEPCSPAYTGSLSPPGGVSTASG